VARELQQQELTALGPFQACVRVCIQCVCMFTFLWNSDGDGDADADADADGDGDGASGC